MYVRTRRREWVPKGGVVFPGETPVDSPQYSCMHTFFSAGSSLFLTTVYAFACGPFVVIIKLVFVCQGVFRSL